MTRRWLPTYYLATPVFWMLDVFCNVSIRASALDGHPALKTAYYLFCIGCGILLFRYPGMQFIGLGESIINLILLFVSFLNPIFGIANMVDSGATVVNPFTVQHVINFILSGTIAIASIQRFLPTEASISRR